VGISPSDAGAAPDMRRGGPQHEPAGQRVDLRFRIVRQHLSELVLKVPAELLPALVRVGQLAPELLAQPSQRTIVGRFSVDIRHVSHR
jgi:hypothetical protein